MRPFCDADEVVIGVICDLLSPFGPTFSYQDWSIRCVAMFWLNFKFTIGSERCIRVLKYASEFEKLWVLEGFWVLFTIVISSKASSRPRIVTVSAVILMYVGIVVGGVFNGVIFSEMSKPATMLPIARRVIGLIIVGLFSFSRSVEGYRGCPVCTKIKMRKL